MEIFFNAFNMTIEVRSSDQIQRAIENFLLKIGV